MSKFVFLIVSVLLLAIPSAASAGQAMNGTALYTVDLETGEATEAGRIGEGDVITGFALVGSADDVGAAFATTEDGDLLALNINSPETIDVRVPISGLGDGETIVGIDVRPATGDLVGLSNYSVVYVIDTTSGEATAPGGALDPELEGDVLGFDFNPTVDRIRVDVATTQNLRLNPETGAVGTNPDTGNPTIDGNTAFAVGDANEGTVPAVVGAGYTNSVDGAESTMLYVIDSATSSLALQDPPNDGVLNTVGPLGIDVTDFTAFDIAPSGSAFLAVPTETGTVNPR